MQSVRQHKVIYFVCIFDHLPHTALVNVDGTVIIGLQVKSDIYNTPHTAHTIVRSHPSQCISHPDLDNSEALIHTLV